MDDALFKEDEDLPQLSDEKSETSHALIMKGVLLVKRARSNLETGFVFQASRIRALKQWGWYKLAKIMSLMLGTKDEVLR